MVDQPVFVTEVDTEKLAEALSSNDDVGVVLRAHLQIERAMVRVLEQKFPHYAELEHQYYSQHMKSLRALGATGPIFDLAHEINKIRNDMAHLRKRERTRILEDDVKRLRNHSLRAFMHSK